MKYVIISNVDYQCRMSKYTFSENPITSKLEIGCSIFDICNFFPKSGVYTMKKAFLTAVFLFPALLLCSCDSKKPVQTGLSTIDSVERAKLHPITSNRPAVDFFEGAVLGNGGLGAIVTTRPDAVVIYFGHNDVWDIRLAEDNKDKIGTFSEIFEKVKAIPDTTGSLKNDRFFWFWRFSLIGALNNGFDGSQILLPHNTWLTVNTSRLNGIIVMDDLF